MMIAHATGPDGKRLIILGLERGNIERLEDGKPMQISAETHPGFPIENTKIVILFGETPRDLIDLVKSSITADTKVVAMPDGSKERPS